MNEFERQSVSASQLLPARHFAATYGSEHVAGTEFVIGAMFVTWGVPTSAILWGLLWGNALAVLTWGLICAPIAVDTRLTLYAYLEKIAGRGTIWLYSLANGILFCVLAGAMITVSASAIRVLFNIPAQLHWYPTHPAFVIVALAVGAVVVTISIRGFKGVAQFAEVCAPWMILMFVAGAAAMLPSLVAATPGAHGLGDFMTIADQHIWIDGDTDMDIWHVAAFAWICNLAMHGGLSDMTLLRYARRASYGYFSALGMFIGHFGAWICAGIMGAGAALLLQTPVSQLDAGGVAFKALGAAGIIAVIIAGWTTSNPTIYRAGLAFHSIHPNWDRKKVTLWTGIVTTVIACFPFVFTKLMDVVGLMGLTLAPIGAVIVAEHWLLPRLAMTRYWSHYKSLPTNWAAVIAWLGSLFVAFLLNQAGLHLFFLLVPTWIAATVIYVVLASQMGARAVYKEQTQADEAARAARQLEEHSWLQRWSSEKREPVNAQSQKPLLMKLSRLIAITCLIGIIVLSAFILLGAVTGTAFNSWLLFITLVYFVTATHWAILRERLDESSV